MRCNRYFICLKSIPACNNRFFISSDCLGKVLNNPHDQPPYFGPLPELVQCVGARSSGAEPNTYAPIGIMTSGAGGRYPNELCGRIWLYSRLRRSTSTFVLRVTCQTLHGPSFSWFFAHFYTPQGFCLLSTMSALKRYSNLSHFHLQNKSLHQQ